MGSVCEEWIQELTKGRIFSLEAIKDPSEEFPGGVAVNLALSLLWLGSLLWYRFHPWPKNFYMPQSWPRKRTRARLESRCLQWSQLTWLCHV